jgi:hypothetical protein
MSFTLLANHISQEYFEASRRERVEREGEVRMKEDETERREEESTGCDLRGADIVSLKCSPLLLLAQITCKVTDA